MDMPGRMVPDKPLKNIPAATDFAHRFNAWFRPCASAAILLLQAWLKASAGNLTGHRADTYALRVEKGNASARRLVRARGCCCACRCRGR